MLTVVDVAQMRAMEAGADALGLPAPALMEIAGRAFADAVEQLYGPFDGQRIAVLVGRGNNGGDGLVAARWLHAAGARAVVLTVARKGRRDAKLDLLHDRGIPVLEVHDDWSHAAIRAALAGSALVVDALLGIGHPRPFEGAMAGLLGILSERTPPVGAAMDRGQPPPIVALDVPSGLDADSGRAEPGTPHCAATITLGAVKRGLLIDAGPAHAGVVIPVGIGAPSGRSEPLAVDALDGQLARSLLPPRSVVGHKASFGRVMVVAGSSRYPGASMLAALGAARAGAGLVTLAAPRGVAAAAAGRMPEITCLPLPGAGDHLTPEAFGALTAGAAEYDALVVGPGLGREEETADLLRALLADKGLAGGPRWVIDADALTLLSRIERWWRLLPDEAILTPHPGEMARLRGEERIDADRITIARESAASWRTNVILKGAYTAIASPTGRTAVSLSANPALATAGTGDVLAGATAGLLAQGAEPFDAARAAVGLHAAAGELARRERGAGGALAGDIAELLPRAAQRLREGWDPWGVAAARERLRTPAW